MGDTSLSNLSTDYLNANKISTKYSSKVIDIATDGEESSYLDFDSYLELLVAQMSNQDFNDPMSDSEVLNQMATYSMLEGIKTMTEQSNIQYATSLVGKAVTVSNNDVYQTGIVDSIMITNGTPSLIIDGISHEVSTITDVTDPAKFADLKTLVGQTVTNGTITGMVTNVIVVGGVEFVVIDDDTLCVRSSVKAVDGSEFVDETTEETTVETDGSPAQDSSALVAEIDETITAAYYPETANATVYGSYEAKADALLAELMSALDGVSYSAAEPSDADLLRSKDEQVYISYIEEPDYAAGIYSDEDSLLSTLSSTNDSSTLKSSDSTYDSYSSSTYQAITTSDCVPFRKNADLYPEEAAMADAYGTRMYDIKWITNSAVTSRIKTDEVIGYTSKGRAVTDLGFSGVGKLGEVVTFSDGTQRVEVIHNNGNSSWLTTTGNHTLDELCEIGEESAKLWSNLTPSEIAIRNYGIKQTVLEQTGITKSMFANYFASMGVNVNLT